MSSEVIKRMREFHKKIDTVMKTGLGIVCFSSADQQTVLILSEPFKILMMMLMSQIMIMLALYFNADLFQFSLM